MKIIISWNAGPTHQLGQREHVEIFLMLIYKISQNAGWIWPAKLIFKKLVWQESKFDVSMI